MEQAELRASFASLSNEVRDLKTVLEHPTVGVIAQHDRRITALESCVRDLELASARGAAIGGGLGAGATGIVLVVGKAMGWW